MYLPSNDQALTGTGGAAALAATGFAYSGMVITAVILFSVGSMLVVIVFGKFRVQRVTDPVSGKRRLRITRNGRPLRGKKN